MPQDARLEFHGQRTRAPRTHNRARCMLKLKRREHRSQRGTRGTDPRATQAPRIRHYAARWRSIKALRRSAPESRSYAKKKPKVRVKVLNWRLLSSKAPEVRCNDAARAGRYNPDAGWATSPGHDATTSASPPSSRYCSRPIPTHVPAHHASPPPLRERKETEKDRQRTFRLLALAPLLLPLLLAVSSRPYPSVHAFVCYSSSRSASLYSVRRNSSASSGRREQGTSASAKTPSPSHSSSHTS
ncbi:hypothetical protein B0H13DRAFT_167612 [Mycena leptocephala]|nr:hypothetical protein B0H13DRAFT_167612 [Mycena leptocephala]